VNRGILRWYVPNPTDEPATESALFGKLQEMALQPRAWSSRTWLLTFPASGNDARAKFNELSGWLRAWQQTTPGFRVVVAATLPNAFLGL
jgi:hypothetical protein